MVKKKRLKYKFCKCPILTPNDLKNGHIRILRKHSKYLIVFSVLGCSVLVSVVDPYMFYSIY